LPNRLSMKRAWCRARRHLVESRRQDRWHQRTCRQARARIRRPQVRCRRTYTTKSGHEKIKDEILRALLASATTFATSPPASTVCMSPGRPSAPHHNSLINTTISGHYHGSHHAADRCWLRRITQQSQRCGLCWTLVWF